MSENPLIRIRVLQHEPFEGAGLIEDWALLNNHPVSVTHIYNNENLPDPDAFDWLVIMGGAMSVNDEDTYPWLKPEKEFVGHAIANGKVIIGICFGSQLIANALGKKVYKNKSKEIGWFPVHLTEAAKQSSFITEQWNNQAFFHWHGETFDLPDNAIHLAYSSACKNQAFSISNKIFAFQFHPETNEHTLGQMVGSGSEELVKDEFVMTAEEIKAKSGIMNSTRSLYFEFLDKLAKVDQPCGSSAGK
jgi:GMP synthase-like glutamine amidotransferase